jgi:hypothetical protein
VYLGEKSTFVIYIRNGEREKRNFIMLSWFTQAIGHESFGNNEKAKKHPLNR